MNVCLSPLRRTALCAALLSALVGVAPAVHAQASALDGIQQRGVVRVGWAPWFPYAYKDTKTNQVAGLTVDLMRALADSLKVKLEFVEDGWPTMIAGLQADKFDVLMPMAITPPRAEAATFSDPFMRVNLGVMVRKADRFKYPDWQSLNKEGMQITVAMGSNTALYAKERFDKAKVVEMKGEPEAVTAVITNKADAWASTYSAFAGSAPGRDRLSVVPGMPFAFNPVALVVRKGDTRMQEAVNRFLADYRGSGELLKAVEKQGLERTEIAQ